ncbi:MAG: ankyrin repeat domain-containing protein [Polyangiales bacterium]
MTSSASCAAAAAGDLDALRAALDAGEPVDGAPDEVMCPLFEAVWNQRVDAVRELLARGASVERPVYTRTPLSYAPQMRVPDDQREAAQGPVLAVIELLLAAGADPAGTPGNSGYTPLLVALRWGTPAIARRLFDAGAPADASHVEAAARAGMVDLVEPLAERAGGDFSTALWHVAARGLRGDEVCGLARRLLARGADVDHAKDGGATPAHWAAYWSNLAMLRVLAEAGARLDLATTGTWRPEGRAKRKGLTAGALLEQALDAERARFADRPELRAAWAALGEALGRPLDAWLAALDAPKPRGRAKKKA